MSFEACFDPGPPGLSVIWLATIDPRNVAQPHLERRLVGWTGGSLRHGSVAGHDALIGQQQLHTSTDAQAVTEYSAVAFFPDRLVYVTVRSGDQALVRRTIASIRVGKKA